MQYARWEELDNIKELLKLEKVNMNEDIKASGIPIAFDKNELYINSNPSHSLVIGSTGSGKTQTITLPMLKLALLANESVIVADPANEIYELTKEQFKEKGYNIIKLNFDEYINTNNWNPFSLIEKSYNQGNIDKAVKLLDDLGFYLLNEIEERNSDPFWINSAISYFIGICLYCLEKEKNISFKKVYEISETLRNNSKDFLNNFDKMSLIYIYLSTTLLAPPETKGSILSVFGDKFKKYISKDNLINMLSNSDFEIDDISKKKTVIYLQAGKSNISKYLIPLFIDQIYSSKEDKKRLNIILDNFYMINPIRDFSKMLDFSRGMNMVFTIMIRGFYDLKNTYGKENYEIIRLCFGNITYLLSQDIETLEEISKNCGNKDKNTPLISVEDLKTMNTFEAIMLMPRIMPFKTNLLPYYKMK